MTQTVLTLKELIDRTRYAVAHGQIEEAVKLAALMAETYPQNAQAQYYAGSICFEVHQYDKAANFFVSALLLDASNRQAKEFLLYALFLKKIEKVDDNLCHCFCNILKNSKDLNSDLIVRVWSEIIKKHGFFSYILKKTQVMDFNEFKDWWQNLSLEDYEMLGADIFTDGISLHIVPDILIESFLKKLRYTFLEYVLGIQKFSSKRHKDVCQKIAISLARCCFNSDYLFCIEDDEQRQVEKLLSNIKSKKLDSFGIAVIGCYNSLSSYSDIMPYLDSFFSPIPDKKNLMPLIQQQVIEPKKEKRLARRISSLSCISDGVSEEVRKQYEENPYPKWTFLKAVHQDQLAQNMNLYQKARTILVAGCATGAYPINVALANPKASIVGIDLSMASLCYGKRNAEKLKVKNLKFIHGDILNISDLKQSFDIIETVGVLHHMKEPQMGLEALLSVLKPGGHIKIGLYSGMARRHIIACQLKFIEMGLTADAKGIRNGREYILSLPDEHPFKTFQGYNDFYNMSMMRDMLFHVQEHCFTLSEVKSMLSTSGLQFLGFSDIGTGEAFDAYRGKFSEDHKMINIDNWHIFEEENPDTFIGMYKFWCRKVG